LIGERLQNLGRYLPTENVVIITDQNVLGLYQDAFPPYNVISIGSGEKVKTFETVGFIYEQLLQLGVDRSTFIVGIGGGIVCDIAGFVASTFLRGLRFGFVSTTLLSQVDASVGGKNGFNLGGYKNIVGVFNQPEFVICDLNLLKALPQREVLNGMAEIVKHAALGDYPLFEYLEKSGSRAFDLDIEVMEKLVYDSVVLKASIVNADEKEQGERRKLNFGHTMGHGIEKITGKPHGESVAVGMVMAAALSMQKGYLTARDNQRLVDLLISLNLPTKVEIDRTQLLEAVGHDKKRVRENIHFVFLNGLGDVRVEEIALAELEKMTIGLF
jgi:3-dehydroquinate synthase